MRTAKAIKRELHVHRATCVGSDMPRLLSYLYDGLPFSLAKVNPYALDPSLTLPSEMISLPTAYKNIALSSRF